MVSVSDVYGEWVVDWVRVGWWVVLVPAFIIHRNLGYCGGTMVRVHIAIDLHWTSRSIRDDSQAILVATAMLALLLNPVGYRAAYVEYRAISPCGTDSCGLQQKRASVAAFTLFIAEAATKGVNIIVFPEYGITGFSSGPASTWHAGGYTEAIPTASASARVVPCDKPASFSGAPSLVALSCAAKKHGMAIVANLMDMDSRGMKMYNTDIALDTDGSYLAKYRKQNLWGETNVGVPSDCPVASFTTSFGITFGLITCADLIYRFPGSALLKQGVRHFVLPAAWSDEMAQMQARSRRMGSDRLRSDRTWSAQVRPDGI